MSSNIHTMKQGNYSQMTRIFRYLLGILLVTLIITTESISRAEFVESNAQLGCAHCSPTTSSSPMGMVKSASSTEVDNSINPVNNHESGQHYLVKWKSQSSPQMIQQAHNWLLERIDAHHSVARAENSTPSPPKNQIRHAFSVGNLQGLSGTFSKELLEELRTHPQVDLIEEDRIVQATDVDVNQGQSAVLEESPHSWGIDRIDQASLPLNQKYFYNQYGGEGIDVYLIDTGIDINNVEFEGRASMPVNLLKDGVTGDCSGHGTHVAGTVGGAQFGVAKKANLIGVRVLDCKSTGQVSDVVAGIQWAIQQHRQSGKSISVINLSLISSYSTVFNSAIDEAVSNGLVVVVAAGNANGDACQTSPGSASSAIRVGASTDTDKRASFSNYGSCVDIFAPGVTIVSAGISNTNATAIKSGTSMASPHVAGTVALWAHAIQNSTSASSFKQVLQNLATRDALDKSSMPALTPNLLLFTSPPESISTSPSS